MRTAKPIADGITIARAVLLIVLPWLGTTRGAAGLPLAVWLLIADWTAGVLDGALARWGRPVAPTWVGDHDLVADMLVSYAHHLFTQDSGVRR